MRLTLGLLAALVLVSPVVAHAQQKSLKSLTDSIVTLVNTSVIPLIYALALVVFLIGVVRFFFVEQGEEGREKGKQFMFWGILGFVVMFSVWGIVNLLLATFGVGSA